MFDLSVVDSKARSMNLPPHLVRAIISVESSGDPLAIRHEPGYRWLWDVRAARPYRGEHDRLPAPPGVSGPTELMQQQTSWGIMQVMGATAREMGFQGKFLSELCEFETGLHYGCLYLDRLRRRFWSRHGWEGVAAAFNAGSPVRNADGRWSNQTYVNRVTNAGGFE